MFLEILEELSQAEEDSIAEEEYKRYQEYLANHWINQLISKRG